MRQEEIITAFTQLGKLMRELGSGKDWEGFTTGVTEEEYQSLLGIINRQKSYNGWFTKESVQKSILALGNYLTYDQLSEWAGGYSYTDTPKRVGIIMAGNIPLVGFHDFLAVLISGNSAICKLSSDDSTLLPSLAQHLIIFLPELKNRIEFSSGKIGQIDAVIATGSNNSLNYFEQYFGKYPHIFRGNRTSLAILDGDETAEDLEKLGHDIFDYFGLGCRNVSHLLIPENYDIDKFFKGIFGFADVINNNKYGNNYDYNKSVYLMNKLPLLDNNFLLLRETDNLHSPLAMVHYQRYGDKQEIPEYLEKNKDQIQAIVGKGYLPFGSAQCPALDDYADGVDTMEWLSSIS